MGLIKFDSSNFIKFGNIKPLGFEGNHVFRQTHVYYIYFIFIIIFIIFIEFIVYHIWMNYNDLTVTSLE
jgi:hypothetical protein